MNDKRVNWRDMSKLEMYERGVQRALALCKLNRIVPPSFAIVRGLHPVRGEVAGLFKLKVRSDLRTRHIEIYIDVNSPPTSTTYPCWMHDDTVYGTIAHELGHHIDITKTSHSAMMTGDLTAFSMRCRQASMEEPISPYHPDVGEWFAEIFRLFVTNPALLKAIRPKAYAFISSNVKPIDDACPREPLGHVPPLDILKEARSMVGPTMCERFLF